MNPFMLSASERLNAWIEFRDSLPAQTEQDQLNNVAKYWALCPFSKWTLDPESSKSWPSVWEMLHEGEYCKNAIAVGIEATLRLSGWDASRLKLVMVKLLSDGEEFFVVIIDDTQVLNYSYGEQISVDEIAHEVDTLYTYKFNGRSYKLTDHK